MASRIRVRWAAGAAAGVVLLTTAAAARFGDSGRAIVPTRQPEQLLISAAISLSDVLDELERVFEAAGAIRVDINLAGSNTLARQIVAGAPVDLFVSANEAEMQRVERAARVREGSRTILLSNQLVVVSPDDRRGRLRSVGDLLGPAVQRIALGDPAAVPAGVYARRYLESLGLWDELAGKVVPTRSVRAALAAVEAGNADAAFVYRTDATTARRAAVAFEIPIRDAPEIRYLAAIIEDGPNPTAAVEFLRFLRSAAARAVFERAGFIVPPSTAETLEPISHMRRHSAADASRPATLLVGHILPVFSLLASCGPGASTPSVLRRMCEIGSSAPRRMAADSLAPLVQ